MKNRESGWLSSTMKLVLDKAASAALRVPLFWLSIAAVLGIFAADQDRLVFWFAIVLLAFFVLRRKQASVFLATGVIVSASLFFQLHRQKMAQIASFPLLPSITDGSSVYLAGKGTVVSDSERRTGTVVRVILALDELRVRETPVALRKGCQVVAVINHPQAGLLKYGSVLSFSGTLSRLEKARAPGAFDPLAYFYRSASALTQLEVQAGDRCEVSESVRGGHALRRAAIASRHWMEKALLHGTESFDPKGYSGIVLAMALGAREHSPDDVEEFFRLSGTMHIFAVSGLHVAVVAAFFWFLLKWTGFSRRQAVWIMIPAILFYAMLTGLRPSSLRAAVMLTVLLAAFALKQRPSMINALGLAALILLAMDSQQLFLPGFQLSFCVVLALMLLATGIANRLHQPFRIDDYLPRRRVGRGRMIVDRAIRLVSGAAGVSIASWLGSVWLMNSHFKGVSPIGLVANIFMVPLAGVVVVIAALSIAFFGIRLVSVSWLLNYVNLGAVFLLSGLAQFFSSLPLAHVHTGSPPAQKVELVSLDVMGLKGDGAILVSSQKKHWLIDCGGEATFSGQVLPLLRDRGINRIEGLLLTHGDGGHIGAAPYLLRHLPPRIVVLSQHPYRARTFPLIETLMANRKISQIQTKAGQSLRLNDAVTWKILHPGAGDPPTNLADDRCLVLLMEAGRWRILFTADSGLLVERLILKQHQHLKADIWIRGQHIESSSGSVEFLDLLSPQVIVSTQAPFPPHERLDNRWIDLLKQKGIRLLTLDEAGVVHLLISPSRLSLEPFLKPEEKIVLQK